MENTDRAFGSDVIVELLRDLGIEYAALNPGASFRGLHDSLVNVDRAPHIITCLHEEIAVAVAHGYAKAARRPMTAMLHDVVGLQHACMAIFNAWCDRVPILLLGGTGPVAADRRRPWIDWIHTALVQGSHIREFTKWDDQPASLSAAVESVLRAHRLTTTAPGAPVYVCLPVEIQEAEVGDQPPAIPDLTTYGSSRAGPDPYAITAAAKLLSSARMPVIVADRAADSQGAIEALSVLARRLHIPLLDKGARMNVRTDDPHDLTGGEAELLARADVLLAVEVQDLTSVVAQAGERDERLRVITISLGDNLVSSWAADYQRLEPVDVRIASDAALALMALAAEVEPPPIKTRDRRKAAIAEMRGRIRQGWKGEAERRWDETPVSPPRLASEVWAALEGRDWVLAHGTLNGWARRLWSWETEGAYLGPAGGGGIGYGPGASIGVALAHRGSERIIVNLQPDGDLLFAPSALWTMEREQLPILNVIWNNRSYYNSEEHALRIARRRERPEERAGIGTRIDSPAVDFAALAKSFGLHAEPTVSDPKALQASLRRAVEAVGSGQPALVEVVAASR